MVAYVQIYILYIMYIATLQYTLLLTTLWFHLLCGREAASI